MRKLFMIVGMLWIGSSISWCYSQVEEAGDAWESGEPGEGDGTPPEEPRERMPPDVLPVHEEHLSVAKGPTTGQGGGKPGGEPGAPEEGAEMNAELKAELLTTLEELESLAGFEPQLYTALSHLDVLETPDLIDKYRQEILEKISQSALHDFSDIVKQQATVADNVQNLSAAEAGVGVQEQVQEMMKVALNWQSRPFVTLLNSMIDAQLDLVRAQTLPSANLEAMVKVMFDSSEIHLKATIAAQEVASMVIETGTGVELVEGPWKSISSDIAAMLQAQNVADVLKVLGIGDKAPSPDAIQEAIDAKIITLQEIASQANEDIPQAILDLYSSVEIFLTDPIAHLIHTAYNVVAPEQRGRVVGNILGTLMSRLESGSGYSLGGQPVEAIEAMGLPRENIILTALEAMKNTQGILPEPFQSQKEASQKAATHLLERNFAPEITPEGQDITAPLTSAKQEYIQSSLAYEATNATYSAQQQASQEQFAAALDMLKDTISQRSINDNQETITREAQNLNNVDQAVRATANGTLLTMRDDILSEQITDVELLRSSRDVTRAMRWWLTDPVTDLLLKLMGEIVADPQFSNAWLDWQTGRGTESIDTLRQGFILRLANESPSTMSIWLANHGFIDEGLRAQVMSLIKTGSDARDATLSNKPLDMLQIGGAKTRSNVIFKLDTYREQALAVAEGKGALALELLQIYQRCSSALGIGFVHLWETHSQAPSDLASLFTDLVSKFQGGSVLKPDIDIRQTLKTLKSMYQETDLLLKGATEQEVEVQVPEIKPIIAEAAAQEQAIETQQATEITLVQNLFKNLANVTNNQPNLHQTAQALLEICFPDEGTTPAIEITPDQLSALIERINEIEGQTQLSPEMQSIGIIASAALLQNGLKNIRTELPEPLPEAIDTLSQEQLSNLSDIRQKVAQAQDYIERFSAAAEEPIVLKNVDLTSLLNEAQTITAALDAREKELQESGPSLLEEFQSLLGQESMTNLMSSTPDDIQHAAQTILDTLLPEDSAIPAIPFEAVEQLETAQTSVVQALSESNSPERTTALQSLNMVIATGQTIALEQTVTQVVQEAQHIVDHPGTATTAQISATIDKLEAADMSITATKPVLDLVQEHLSQPTTAIDQSIAQRLTQQGEQNIIKNITAGAEAIRANINNMTELGISQDISTLKNPLLETEGPQLQNLVKQLREQDLTYKTGLARLWSLLVYRVIDFVSSGKPTAGLDRALTNITDQMQAASATQFPEVYSSLIKQLIGGMSKLVAGEPIIAAKIEALQTMLPK